MGRFLGNFFFSTLSKYFFLYWVILFCQPVAWGLSLA
jgi:hypothetical protein